MNHEQVEQVWSALWAGKYSALELYQLTSHTEGAKARLDATEAEIYAAMDLIKSTAKDEETSDG